ncbi:MAG TPA: hypothetical protein VGC30_14685 [Dokdonella sp.]
MLVVTELLGIATASLEGFGFTGVGAGFVGAAGLLRVAWFGFAVDFTGFAGAAFFAAGFFGAALAGAAFAAGFVVAGRAGVFAGTGFAIGFFAAAAGRLPAALLALAEARVAACGRGDVFGAFARGVCLLFAIPEAYLVTRRSRVIA